MKKRNRLLSVLLVLAMLIAGMTFILPASAAGGEFANDEAAIAAGYSFRVDGKYYKTLSDAYEDIPENGTVTMIADYTNAVGC